MAEPKARRHRYFSRRTLTPRRLPTTDDDGFVGIYSPWAVLWGVLFLIVPLSYVYIVLVLLRELCRLAPDTVYQPLQLYVPYLAKLIDRMHQSSRIVEYWCWIEGIFYICLKIHIYILQSKDPLEASLSAAPLMELKDRQTLWDRMMRCESDDMSNFLSGWFFDEPIENISKYDVRDFVAWSMFEGRHQEHLTERELEQLEQFVEEAEYRISIQLHGVDSGDEEEEKKGEDDERTNGSLEVAAVSIPSARSSDSLAQRPEWMKDLPKPKKMFRFTEERTHEESNFFFDLYASYKTRYEEMLKRTDFHPVQDFRDMVANADFHPVQDLRNLMAETAQHLAEAEESAKAKATQLYESLIPSGSQMDKQLTAMSQATYTQLVEAWNSVKNMKERLETARFLSKQRQRIRQQLKGYRVMLNRMRDMSSAVPSKQMAAMMRRITECNQALESLESRAQNAFVQATGFARKNLPFLQQHEPHSFAKYSSDPLLGIATYPLGFHLLILGGTEIPLRIYMMRRGFERRTIGTVAYYFHPGLDSSMDEHSHSEGSSHSSRNDDDPNNRTRTPIVFVHGIGIGLIVYKLLIDKLLETNRPILLPEIPYVSGFRPFQSPQGVLSPATVASTMTAMLATHGYMRATWVGHSYGTTWLSYMVQYASHAVSAVLFLDPICFCLHVPRLTKQFVYSKPDPGTVSYIIRTDVIVNWTIQRSFPWNWIVLFLEQISVPCSIYLSDKDALVPVQRVEQYLRTNGIPIRDFGMEYESDANAAMIGCTVFRGDGHGDWTERPQATVPSIAEAVESLCRRADETVLDDDHDDYYDDDDQK